MSAREVLRHRRLDRLAIHDFDEIGIPSKPTRRFRQEANERWLRRALDYRRVGIDLMLAGQTPYGELLATPSAPRLESVSACLLDCDDEARTARLRRRGPESWAHSSGRLADYLNWTEWMRRHAVDPQHMPEVLR